MFDIKSDAKFTDGNGRSVGCLDVVEYQYGERRGVLLEVLQDGDAYVVFRDSRNVEAVKWARLCKVPLVDEE